MSALARIGALVVALVAVFAAAVGVGRATGPVGPVGPADDVEAAHADDGHPDDSRPDDSRPESDRAEPAAVEALPGGLASSQAGYTLVPEQTTFAPGTRELAFRIDDARGDAVTDFDVEHDEPMHLIAVRRDFSGFQHVHPTLDDEGRWRVPLELTAGAWRVFADFVPSGDDGLTLGADLAVAGPTEIAPRGDESRTASVDGYTVTLDGDLVAGGHAMLGLTVSKDGEPVTDLEPYLGAYGHLVALREGDLAYLHVHPEDGPSGPTVEFGAEVPSAGRYHLYLDFQHDGVVRTAAFVVDTTGADAGTTNPEGGADDHADDEQHDH